MKRHKTARPNIVYYNHKTRLHNGRPDRRFLLRYRHNGTQVEEAVGWASDGWNLTKANELLGEIRRNQRRAEGPQSLREKRELEKQRIEAEEERKKQLARDSVTFGEYFNDPYLPRAQRKKTRWTWKRELSLFNRWIEPVIGDLPLKEIMITHVESIEEAMENAEQSPRSIQYMVAVVRQVFNHARQDDIYKGENPVDRVRKTKMPDNRRLRFLSREEAHELLKALKAASVPVYEMALLALSCGLRAAEIFNLRWGDVNLKNGNIAIRDSKKNVVTAYVYMTAEVLEIIRAKEPRPPAPQTLLFPDRDGGQRRETPPIFRRTVDRLKLNEGVSDRRDRLVFHSLRHTYASWLARAGVPLLVIRERMRHKTLAMSDRYSHLSPDAGRGTVQVIEAAMNAPAR